MARITDVSSGIRRETKKLAVYEEHGVISAIKSLVYDPKPLELSVGKVKQG